MKIRARAALVMAATVTLASGSTAAAQARPAGQTGVGGQAGPASQLGQAAPYEYLGWGNPQPLTQVMAATGIRQLTLAFMLSDGTCNPAWDGSRPLLGGVDQAAIRSFRAAGGDVQVSFGGWSGESSATSAPTPVTWPRRT